MQKVICNKLVNTLKPSEKVYEVRDTQLKGLLLRVQPSGVMTYYLEYKRGKRVKVGRADAITPLQARELAKAQLSEHYQGKDPIENKKRVKAESFIRFLEDIYHPYLVANLRTGEKTFERLKSSFTEFHNLPLDQITPFAVEKWRSRRQSEGLKASSINRELADLRSALTRAAAWEIVEVETLAKVKPSRIDSNPMPRYLKPDEEVQLRKALMEREKKLVEARENHNKWLMERNYSVRPSIESSSFADHLMPAVLLSINTGLRRGELFGLKWTDIDLSVEQPMLTVAGDKAKSGKTRHIPLNEEALAVLKQWKLQGGLKSLYVFVGKNGKPFHDIRSSWKGVLASAKITDFRWHDLRHTFASKLVQAGADLNTVRELMGHSDYKMTLRYAHLAPEQNADAVARLKPALPKGLTPLKENIS